MINERGLDLVWPRVLASSLSVIFVENVLLLEGGTVKLTKLFKDTNSGGEGCPTVYLADSGEFVVQGNLLDTATTSELENILPGETAVRISADIVLGAVERYTAAREQ
jgi:hypothetical protein